jgi:dipeptidyl aminopeptidase/acylaminoacyl peptidase
MAHSPMRYVRQVETPIMLLHGEADIRCPIGQTEQFFTALKRLGKEAVYVRYPGQYHGFTKPSFIVDRWTRTIGWFEHYLMEG